jgi:iron(III) transport system permease protein
VSRRALPALLSWAFVAAVALVFVAPLAALFENATTATLAETIEGASFTKILLVTIGTGVAAAALSVALGVVFARQFARYEWRGRRAQRLVALLPYLVPNFILATAYVVAWNPGTGLLNGWLPFPLGLYGVWGMTVALGVAHMPIAMLMLEDKLRRIDGTLAEAARLSGATPWQVTRRIELPLLRPTVVAAFGLCLSLDVSAFAIPAWLGAPARAYPLTYKIYQAIQVGGQDGLPQAAVYSLLLFVLVLPILVLTARAQRHERRYAVVTGKAPRQSQTRQSIAGFAAFQAFYAATQVALVVLPMLCLFASTWTMPGCLQERGIACLAEPTARAYRYVLFDLAETRLAFKGSAVWGSLSALAVMALALASLVLLQRRAQALRSVEWLYALLTATPGAIIALGLIAAASGRFGVNLYNTPWIVVAAMLLKHESLAFQPLRTGLTNIAAPLLEAGRLAGATPTRLWTRIILPLLRPECVGGFFLVLVPILGELTMSIFLTSPSYRSLGTVLFDLQDYADHASAAALSMLLVVLILLANEAGRLLTRGRFGY